MNVNEAENLKSSSDVGKHITEAWKRWQSNVTMNGPFIWKVVESSSLEVQSKSCLSGKSASTHDTSTTSVRQFLEDSEDEDSEDIISVQKSTHIFRIELQSCSTENMYKFAMWLTDIPVNNEEYESLLGKYIHIKRSMTNIKSCVDSNVYAKLMGMYDHLESILRCQARNGADL